MPYCFIPGLNLWYGGEENNLQFHGDEIANSTHELKKGAKRAQYFVQQAQATSGGSDLDSPLRGTSACCHHGFDIRLVVCNANYPRKETGNIARVIDTLQMQTFRLACSTPSYFRIQSKKKIPHGHRHCQYSRSQSNGLSFLRTSAAMLSDSSPVTSPALVAQYSFQNL